MPLLLRHDAIRLLEASLESLQLAVSSIAVTKRWDFRESAARFAVEIGLLGTAAELAMAACLVQAFGPSVLSRAETGKYKTAAEILSDFRKLVSDSKLVSSFLTTGVDDSASHRKALIEAVSGFGLLITARAGGFHAGRGPGLEGVAVQAQKVADFLDLLRQASKIQPYVRSVPRCPLHLFDRTVLIENIASRLEGASEDESIEAIASIFLVLPELPDDEPDWLAALSRVSIAPKKPDLVYLIDVLAKASPVSLRRTSGAGDATPVRVSPSDPDAIPISIQNLKREFSSPADAWYADIATANTRLSGGSLDLPPAGVVRGVFAVGVEEAQLLAEGTNFSAHQSWPAILASLSVQGTPGPHFFLVRRTDDLHQLKALIQKASGLGNATLKGNADTLMTALKAMIGNKALGTNNKHYAALIEDSSRAEHARELLKYALDRSKGTVRELMKDLEPSVLEAADGKTPIRAPLEKLLDQPGASEFVLRYWSRILCEAATELDDVGVVAKVLERPDLSVAHTAAKKALLRIDFRANGPAIK